MVNIWALFILVRTLFNPLRTKPCLNFVQQNEFGFVQDLKVLATFKNEFSLVPIAIGIGSFVSRQKNRHVKLIRTKIML